MFTVKNLRTHVFPPEDYIVGSGLLKRNSILVIGGPPKSMKSMVSMSLALDLASGRPLWGLGVNSHNSGFGVSRPHRVLIIEKELGYEDCQIRLRTMWNGLGPRAQELVDENVMVDSCDMTLRLDTTDGQLAMKRAIEMARPDVVVLDPLVEFHQLNEDHSQDMGKVLGALDLLRYRLGFATVINHHRTKLPRDGAVTEDDTPESLRGSSRLFGKVDSVVMLRANPHRPGVVVASFTLRRGRPIPTMRLRVDLDTLLTSFGGWVDQPAPGNGQQPGSTAVN
jgi:RecA-family ATPase